MLDPRQREACMIFTTQRGAYIPHGRTDIIILFLNKISVLLHGIGTPNTYLIQHTVIQSTRDSTADDAMRSVRCDKM